VQDGSKAVTWGEAEDGEPLPVFGMAESIHAWGWRGRWILCSAKTRRSRVPLPHHSGSGHPSGPRPFIVLCPGPMP
jgi:hypothetical protein